MKTTFSALKVWLAVGIIIVVFGCAKKGDDGGGGGYNGYCPTCYGSTGYNTGGGVGPGGILFSASAKSYLSDGLQVDMEIDFVSTTAGGTSSTATARGRVRMNRGDPLCNVNNGVFTPVDMAIVEGASTLQISGTTTTYVTGTIVVAGPVGQFQIRLDPTGVRVNGNTSGTPMVTIWGNRLPFYLSGKTAPGSCNDVNMGWPLQGL